MQRLPCGQRVRRMKASKAIVLDVNAGRTRPCAETRSVMASPRVERGVAEMPAPPGSAEPHSIRKLVSHSRRNFSFSTTILRLPL